MITNSGKKLTSNMKLVRRISQEDKFATLQRLKTSTSGLPTLEATKRLEKNGENAITNKKADHNFSLLVKSFSAPFTLILFVLAIISLITNYIWAPLHTKDLSTPSIMVVIAIISGLLNFIQNKQTDHALDNLLDRISSKVLVRRDKEEQVIASKDIVIGDIICLKKGDSVPADIRLLETDDFYCSSSSLTGEKHPVKKDASKKPTKGQLSTYLDYPNIAYQGTSVVAGTAMGVVFATGDNTIFGGLAQDVSRSKISLTGLDLGIKGVLKLLLMTTAIILPFVLIVADLTKGSFINALIFSGAAGFGLLPQILPVKVTNNIVQGFITDEKIKERATTI